MDVLLVFIVDKTTVQKNIIRIQTKFQIKFAVHNGHNKNNVLSIIIKVGHALKFIQILTMPCQYVLNINNNADQSTILILLIFKMSLRLLIFQLYHLDRLVIIY